MRTKDISVIIPTYNRLDILKQSIDAWREVKKATTYSFELIYADNASPDGTAEYLESIHDLPIILLKSGPSSLSHRRNLAIYASTGKRILFAGDDIFPQPDFLNKHVEIGKKIGKQHAVLGNIFWHPDLPQTHLLRHITEIGCEQFDFEHLIPHEYTNFQHFYTANVSLDRSTLYQEDWFFDESFPEPNFEDVELAFRLNKKGMAVYFAPEIVAYHHHSYTTAGFCKRQQSAGRMSTYFLKLQPEADQMLGIKKLEEQFKIFKNCDWLNIQHSFLPKISDVQKMITHYENELRNNQSSFSLQRTLSDYYLRLFQYMYEKGVLESLNYDFDTIDSFLMQKLFSFDTFLSNSQQEIEIQSNLSIPLIEKNQLFDYWSKMNTKSKTEADVRLVWWRRRLESTKVWTYYTLLQKYRQFFVFSRLMVILRKPLLFMRKVRRKIFGFWRKLYFKYLLHADQNDPSIGIVLKEMPSETVLKTFFSLFDTQKVALFLLKNNHFSKIVSVTSQDTVTNSALEANKFIWQLNIDLQLSHIIAIHNALLALSLLNLDYLLFENQQSKDTKIDSFFPDNLILTTSLQSQPLQTQILGKKIFTPYLEPSNHEKNTIDFPLHVIDHNYLVGKNAQEGHKRLNWDLIRFPEKGFLDVQKNKPLIFIFPTFLAVGGVEKNTLAVIKELSHIYDFVIINFEPLQKSQGSLHSEFLPYVRAIYDLGEILPQELYLKAIRYLQKNYQPDLLWICNGCPWLSNNLDEIRNIFINTPIVDQQVYDTTAGWISEYGRDSIKKLDRYIATNKKISRVFTQKYNLNAQKIDLIYPCLDSSRVTKAKRSALSANQIEEKYLLPHGKTLLTFIGRLTDQKRPLFFIQLAKKLSRNKRLHFVMIGDGPLGEEVDDYIEKNRLTNVTRVTYTSNPCEILKLSSALLILSEYEGLPISLLESLAMGVPFFSTDVGGIRDLLDEYGSGFITDSISIDDLETDLISFIKEIDSYRQKADTHSLNVLNRFMAKTIAKQYQDCFVKASAQYETEK